MTHITSHQRSNDGTRPGAGKRSSGYRGGGGNRVSRQGTGDEAIPGFCHLT